MGCDLVCEACLGLFVFLQKSRASQYILNRFIIHQRWYHTFSCSAPSKIELISISASLTCYHIFFNCEFFYTKALFPLQWLAWQKTKIQHHLFLNKHACTPWNKLYTCRGVVVGCRVSDCRRPSKVHLHPVSNVEVITTSFLRGETILGHNLYIHTDTANSLWFSLKAVAWTSSGPSPWQQHI